MILLAASILIFLLDGGQKTFISVGKTFPAGHSPMVQVDPWCCRGRAEGDERTADRQDNEEFDAETHMFTRANFCSSVTGAEHAERLFCCRRGSRYILCAFPILPC